jgi:hypothetical protein
MSWTPQTIPAFTTPPLGIDQRAKIFKTICRDDSSRGKFPERVFDFTWQTPGCADELGHERRSEARQSFENLSCWMRERGSKEGWLLPTLTQIEQPPRILTQKNRDGCNPRRPDATTTSLPGSAAVHGFKDVEGWMRRQSSPHHLTGETQTIQQFRGIVGDSARQYVAFPGRGRNLVALELCQHMKCALNPVELSARREVLPPEQEPCEFGSRDRLNLAPKPPDRESVDTRKQTSVAPAGFSLSGRTEPAAKNLSL